VQTLSRLNRTRTGKDQTYILDFQNTMEDIQSAFRPYFESTTVEAMSDPNMVYDLEGRLYKFGYLDKQEIERFAQVYFKGTLSGGDRAQLEGLVKHAVARFEVDDDEGRQEEFRQLLKSYGRFYSFIAQVMRLEDTSLEKLASYGNWLSCLLPNREVPPEIEITDDIIRLQAFKVEQKEAGSASLAAGDTDALKAISEFGAKPYTEDEKKELSEILQAFNERHGTQFTEADMIRFEQVNREILDDNMSDMLRNNAPDVVYAAFRDAFFQGAIRMFQRDNEMRNIVLTDAEARDKATRHFFNRALREVRSGTVGGVSTP
jgi:type I restriction enzyme R subunit